ncbi:MAG: hypothetical protein C5S41_07410 [Candidatus Methanomarinus sp.]|jgi:hypothetical protein|nr:MAG: hypothetical protein C5S41_07410 [ANME-2 cluster archaeon]KAF5424584.1 hypothetical protein C5S42_12875 [ANME-2 cluster archaeon]
MELELEVDGEDISVNHFIEQIFAGVVGGAAECLNGVEEDWKEIKLIITR